MDYISIFLFSTILCITPGPNNYMVMASSLNFQYRDIYPQILGMTFGCFSLCVIMGFGLLQLVYLYPDSHHFLKIITCTFILYLAFKFSLATPKDPNENSLRKPISFIQALSFQLVNPKGWAAAMGVISLHMHNSQTAAFSLSIFIVAFIFAFNVFFSKIVWMFFGLFIKKILNKPLHQRICNIVMGFLLALTVIPIIVASRF